MKLKGLIFLTIFSTVYFVSAHASVGCMDTSLHAYACNDGKLCRLRQFDNKMLHYVPCSCPCTTFEIVDKKAKCLRCWHFRDPRYLDLNPNIVNFKYATQQMTVILEKR